MMMTHSFVNPFRTLSSEMDRLFETLVSGAPRIAGSRSQATPPLNMWEDDECIYVEAELPGTALEDIDVSVVGADLSIKGRRTVDFPEQARAYRRERPTGSFERTVTLPGEIDADRVDAKLTDGILTVTLPKAAARRPRRIVVHGA